MKRLTNNITAIAILFLLLFSGKANSQCGPLATTTASNNNQNGIMFDIQAIQTVNITQFAMNFGAGNHTIYIYTKNGTHVGFTNNAAAWTLLGTVSNWTATGGTYNMIPIVFNKLLCPNEVYYPLFH